MEKLYFLVTQAKTYGTGQDPIRLLQNYFVTEGAFMHAFIIAAIVAVAGLAIYYGIFGMKIFKLATRPVYWCMLVLVGLVTILFTQISVIGSAKQQTGFFASAETVKYTNVDGRNYFDQYIEDLTPEEAEEAVEQRSALEKEMSGFCDVVVSLDFLNALYAILIFFILSFAIKNMTTHAKKIPF